MAEKRILQELSITDLATPATRLYARRSTGAQNAIALVMKDTAFAGNHTSQTTIELRCQRTEAHRLARYLLSL